MTADDALSLPEDSTLLIVDDDEPFRQRLAQSMARRGFQVTTAPSIAEAVRRTSQDPPAYAVIDLRLGDGHGMELVNILREVAPDTRIVILTGYGNIASAVAAVKAGAIDFLPKPVEAERLAAALLGWDAGAGTGVEQPMSAERARWEHIQRVHDECGRNVSETSRRLRMHRRTLQRILSKHAPPE